jgi:hypothetical protein
LYYSYPQDEYLSYGPRPVKLCLAQWIFQFLFRYIYIYIINSRIWFGLVKFSKKFKFSFGGLLQNEQVYHITDLLISMYKDYSQRCGLQFTASNDIDIISFTYIIDMDRDTGICTYPMFLHQRDQFTLCQIIWWTGLSFYKFGLEKINRSWEKNINKFMSEWVSDCCLMPIQQFVSYIMVKTS